MDIGKNLIGSSVRIDFVDHFRFDKISRKQLLVNLTKYSSNQAVGDVEEVTDEFVILRNSWSSNHDYIAGIAIFRPTIKKLTVLKPKAHTKA